MDINYIIENFSKDSKYINDIDGVIKYLENSGLNIHDINILLNQIIKYNKEIDEKLILENNNFRKVLYESNTTKNSKNEIYSSNNNEINIKVPEKKENKSIEDLDISFYINLINSCHSIDEINYSLPKKYVQNYNHIINLIILYYLEEIINAKKMINTEKGNNDKETLEFFDEYIDKNRKKIDIIKKYRNELEEKKESIEISDITEEQNNIIFLKTNSGKICALEDIDDIPIEFYNSIYELLNSIKVGTFKNAKVITNNNTIGKLSEVKGEQTRIIFDRVDKNTYIILHIFIKKVDKNSYYKTMLQNRSSLYNNKKKDILSTMSQQVLEENKLYEEQLLNILGKGKEKKLVLKGDINE